MIKEMALKALLTAAGFLPQHIPTMMCIAKWESSLRPDAVNVNTDGSVDIGLFQINNRYWVDIEGGGCPYSMEELFDPVNNVSCAKTVFDAMGFRAWVAYNTRQECKNIEIPKIIPQQDIIRQEIY